MGILLRRLALPAVVLAAASALLSGCVFGETRVPYDVGEVRISGGDELLVEFGEINTSIGDSWYLVTPPDATVLSDGGYHAEVDSFCDDAGCPSTFAWRFSAVSPGTTTVEFLYCYRSGPDDCVPEKGMNPEDVERLTAEGDPPRPRPIPLRVVVEE